MVVNLVNGTSQGLTTLRPECSAEQLKTLNPITKEGARTFRLRRRLWQTVLQFLFLCSSGLLLNTGTHSNLRFPSNYYYYYRLEGRPELSVILPSFSRSPLHTVATHKVTNLFECGLPRRLPSIRFHRSASEDDQLTDCLWSPASVLNSQSIDCYVHFELTFLVRF